MKQPYYSHNGITIYHGDCRAVLAELPSESVQCCVTSPPYYGLRDYGNEAQIGLEQTPDEYVDAMVGVFREVRRVLRADGVLWLNLGDSYASVKSRYSSRPHTLSGKDRGDNHDRKPDLYHCAKEIGIKDKDLLGIPWRVAFALQSDGWYLRQDIIWHKPNPMPESVTDRCTKAHEYIFLMSKSARYYYDAEAIAEEAEHPQMLHKSQNKTDKQESAYLGNAPTNLGRCGTSADGLRNRRSVWTIPTQPFSGAHFAVFPPKLIEPCIAAGSRIGDTILDPFSGAGTTAMVAKENGRGCIGIELNQDYIEIAAKRLRQEVLSFGD